MPVIKLASAEARKTTAVRGQRVSQQFWLSAVLSWVTELWPDCESHLGRTGMRGHDLPSVIKLLEVHGGVPHYRLLGTRKRDRPPGEG